MDTSETTSDDRAGRARGRPKVLSDEERRTRLIDLALEIFCEVGYERTTMDLVAARARVSKQTLYRLFSGKVALFAAVVDLHRRSLFALPGDYDDMSVAEALAAIMRADLDDEVYRRRMMLVEGVLPEITRHPEILETLRRHGAEPAREELGRWLKREMDRGRVAPSDDPMLLADILVQMVFHVVQFRDSACGGVASGPTDRSMVVRRCIDVFLNGIAAR